MLLYIDTKYCWFVLVSFFFFLLSKLDLSLRSLSLELFESPYGVEKKIFENCIRHCINPRGKFILLPQEKGPGPRF